MQKFKSFVQSAVDGVTSFCRKAVETCKAVVRPAAAVGAAVLAFSFAPSQASAAIVLTEFTDALTEVGTAVTGALGDTVSAGLAIAGVIMGGMLLWRLFRRIAKA